MGFGGFRIAIIAMQAILQFSFPCILIFDEDPIAKQELTD